jgi:hypothetical protein
MVADGVVHTHELAVAGKDRRGMSSTLPPMNQRAAMWS